MATVATRPGFWGGWRVRLEDWRHRMISDPRFQRFAARFPLTRPIVKRKANALFDLTAGFVYSQILAVCVELDLFRDLSQGARSLNRLAQRYGIEEGRLKVLLDGAVALQLLARRGEDGYALGELGACILGTPGLPEMIKHHALLYRDLEDPLSLLRDPKRRTQLGDFWAYAAPNAQGQPKTAMGLQEAESYSELMASSQGFIAEDVLDAFDFAPFSRFVDVGGGHGAFAKAALKRHSHLESVVFDLPPVAARAKAELAGFGGRARACGGDFLVGDLPKAKLMSLVRVLYDHQDRNAARILANVFRALPSGGKLLIAEPMAATRGSEAMGAAYFGFYLMAMGGGLSRSFEDLKALAEATGFQDVRRHRSRRPMLVSVMSAVKP